MCWRARSCRFVTDETDDELLAKLNDEAEVTQDYVTPGGKVIPAIYIRLRNRINRCAGGLGSIVEGDGHAQSVLLLSHDVARGSPAAETRNPARVSRLVAGSFLSRPYYFSVPFSSVTSPPHPLVHMLPTPSKEDAGDLQEEARSRGERREGAQDSIVLAE